MIEILDSIKRAYMNSSYQNKLVTTLFILILVPVILLSSFSYYQNKEMIKTQSITLSELFLNQVENSINAKLTDLTNVAKTLSRHTIITEVLEKDPSSTSIAEQIQDLKDLDVIISSSLSSSTIYNIRLYVNNGFIYSDRRVSTYNLDSVADAEWAKVLSDFYAVVYFAEPYEYTYILNNTKRIISAMIPIRSSKDFEKTIGIICVDMLEDDIIELMKVADYTTKGEIMITNRTGNPLFTYTTSDEPILGELKYVWEDNPTKHISVIDNNVVGRTSLWNTWNLTSVASMEDLLATQSNLKLQFIILVIIVGCCVYFLAYIYARHNARRINSLAKQIQVVESGNFDVNCIVDSADEIGDLQTSFNYMVRKINSLMKEQYLLGKNLNAMELKVLQAQINPHFLYNTLDLISWTAKRYDMEEVCDIVVKLSKFYRISLSNGSDYISLANEIEHVSLYVQLQSLRFSRKINLNITIDKELENYMIMKLLLQPIVENCIIHGISNSDTEQGEINITAALQNEMIQISVTDNGIGMDYSTINRLINYGVIHNDSKYLGGYGLKNVINRLKLYYDDQARITIESNHNMGTAVIITIPYRYNQSEYLR